MTDVKLGTTPTESAQRDAIHIAIAPVIAGADLQPGQHVGLHNGTAILSANDSAVGIVDPFRKSPVRNGERFWLLLYQNTIVGMRHHWKHPAFVEESKPNEDNQKAVSIAWLTKTAEYCGVDYESMMSRIADDDFIHMGEDERYKNVDDAEFAKHVEIVTGKTGAYPPFSCSC